jgi:hypothetical protein
MVTECTICFKGSNLCILPTDSDDDNSHSACKGRKMSHLLWNKIEFQCLQDPAPGSYREAGESSLHLPNLILQDQL